MTRMAAGAVVVLAVLGAADVQASGVSVRVRLSDSGIVSPAIRARAAAEADAILVRAGLNPTWADCSADVPQPAICKTPPSATDVIVRLLPGGGAERDGFVGLGFAFVEPSARRAVLATVYVDTVNRIAREAGVDATDLLGRAIAHEIGHLLLNTNDHAPAGLMRARWSRQELQRDASSDWWFREAESRMMRVRLEDAASINSARADPGVVPSLLSRQAQ